MSRRFQMGFPLLLKRLPTAGVSDAERIIVSAATTLTSERRELLADLRRQLPHLSERGRERTERAIRRLELELAPGKAREAEVLK